MQLASMSRKLETKNASSSKKAKLSNKASTSTLDVGVLETAPSGFDQDLLRCPICSQFPRKQVFQCNTGHSVCASCLPKLRKCPTCQGLYKNVRNYLAEGLLDSMKFDCSWKVLGCKITPMPRTDLTSHEAQCEFNPNNVKFCLMFDKSCNNMFCPVSAKDPGQMNIFLDHLKTVHSDFTVRDVKVRENFCIHFKKDWSAESIWTGLHSHGETSLCRTILRVNPTITNQDQSRCQLFVILLSRFVEMNRHSPAAAFLLRCIRLTDDSKDKMSISFSLTGHQTDGPQVPDLNWTVQPHGIRLVKDVWVGRRMDDLSYYHMIPASFVLDHYITEEGIPIKCIFS